MKLVSVRGNRRGLNTFGEIYGLKRKWLGLEPDFLFRRRILDVIQIRGVMRNNDRWW